MITPRYTLLLAAASLTALSFGSCGKDRSAEERRAALVLERAKEALARRDHQTSRRLLSELLSLELALERAPRAAEAALLLADNYIAGADFDSAFASAQQAQALYRDAADRAGQRGAALAQARAHHICGNDARAYRLLTDELHIEQALGTTEGERELKWRLLPVARNMGHVEAEQRLIKELMDDATERIDSPAIARAQYAFGEIFLHRRMLDSSAVRFRAAASLAELTRDTIFYIQSLQQCGLVSATSGDVTNAFRFFASGLRLTDRVHGAGRLREEMLLRVGNIYIRQERFESARRFLNAALRSAIKTENKLIEAYALLQLGHTHAGVRSAEAAEYYDAGAALLSHIGAPRGNAYAELCLGTSAMNAGRFDKALVHLRSAARSEDSTIAIHHHSDVLSDCESAFAPVLISPYEALTGLLIRLGKYDEAYEMAVRKNQLDIFRMLSGTDIATNDPALDAALNTFSRARWNYVGAERQLEEAFEHRSESLTLAANVRSSLMRHRARMIDVGDSIATFNKRLRSALLIQPVGLDDVRPLLPENTVLVHYVPTERALYAFILSRHSFSVQLAAVEQSQLLAVMHRFLSTLRQRSVDVEPANAAALERTITDLSSQLYSLFLRPVESGLDHSSALLVVMPSELPRIPIHALREPRGAFAIDRWTIRMLSDEGQLLIDRPFASRLSRVIAFGNQGRTSIDVEYELADVRAFVRDFEVRVNREATLKTLQGMRGDVLHIACDLHFNAERADNSFIALTAGKEYAAETDVNLGALLSTARFPLVLFSGLNNEPFRATVPRMFRMNGAGDVIMSGYLPTRRAKRMFNELFYTRLMAGNSADVSYREALREMIGTKEYAQPHMWAAFTLW